MARPAAPASTGISARRSGALACSQRRTSTIASVPSAVIRITRWTRVDGVGQPGLVGHHQDVPRHPCLSERVEVEEHQPQQFERDHHDRQRADQHAVDRLREMREREAGQQERQRQQPQVAEPDAERQRRRRHPLARAAARRTTRARSRASARRPGSPGVASIATAPLARNDQPTISDTTASYERPSRATTTNAVTPDAKPATIRKRRSSAMSVAGCNAAWARSVSVPRH